MKPVHLGRRNLKIIFGTSFVIAIVDLLILYAPYGQFNMSLTKAFLLLIANGGYLIFMIAGLMITAVQNAARIRAVYAERNRQADAEAIGRAVEDAIRRTQSKE